MLSFLALHSYVKFCANAANTDFIVGIPLSWAHNAYAAIALCVGTALLLMRHKCPMLAPFRCCVCSIERALIVQAYELHVVEPVANVVETNQHNHPVSVSV